MPRVKREKSHPWNNAVKIFYKSPEKVEYNKKLADYYGVVAGAYDHKSKRTYKSNNPNGAGDYKLGKWANVKKVQND